MEMFGRDYGKQIIRLLKRFAKSQSYDGAQCVVDFTEGVPEYMLIDPAVIEVSDCL
jgi:hypothetical protein